MDPLGAHNALKKNTEKDPRVKYTRETSATETHQHTLSIGLSGIPFSQT